MVIFVLLACIIGSGLIAVSGGVRWLWRIPALLVCSMGSLALAWTLVQEEVFLGPKTAWYNTAPFREIIFFVTMIAGMMCRQISVAVELYMKDRARKRTGADKARLTLEPIDLLYPFLFSAITFGSLIANIGDKSVSVITLTLSFQNGFFWQTLIRKPAD